MAGAGESYDDVEQLYSLSSNTQSRKMPLPGRSNRTFVADVPNALISDRRVPTRQVGRLHVLVAGCITHIPAGGLRNGIFVWDVVDHNMSRHRGPGQDGDCGS